MQGVAPWWQSRRFVLAAALAAVLPLLLVPLPPLVDLPGHIGRYRILAEAGAGPLAQHFEVHRALIGNLGVNGLVLLLHPLLDVEPAARLVVTFIPLATVLAMLWVAREAHGRLPPAAAFALPLAYAYPLQFGFVNFCLAAALALAGLALWLRLAGRRWQPLLFAALAGPLWLCHSFGWAMLGLFAFGAEWQRLRHAGERWPVTMAHAALQVAPMGWPALLMLLGSEQLNGSTGDWFNLRFKAMAVAGVLRERWKAWDVAAAIVLTLLVWASLRSSRLRSAPVLAIPALLGF